MALMGYLIFFILFLFGIAVGSFLNVLIYRMESFDGFDELAASNFRTGENETPNYRGWTSIVGGRSYCPRCRHQIRWYDNIPLLSFLILTGKCRDCQGKISIQYPLVEAATGILFIVIYYLASELRITNYELWNKCFSYDFFHVSCFMFHVSLIYLFAVFSGLFAILVYDFKHYIIPNKILYPLIILVLIFGIFNLFGDWNLFRISDLGFRILEHGRQLLLSLTIPVFFLSLIVVSRGRWMGMGDVKLAFFMALFLGWPNVLVATILSFWLGALVSMPLLLFGHKKIKSQIPFGPFLILGTFIAYFWGERIIGWYLGIRF